MGRNGVIVMRDLYKIIDKLTSDKVMVNFKSFPGGNLNVAIYKYNPDLNFFYDATSLDELETLIKKDFGHLLLGSMPLPPGMPRLR
jgi:hypothetical protein